MYSIPKKIDKLVLWLRQNQFFNLFGCIAWRILFSFIIVAFGQPVFSSFLSLCAASFGYALYWLAIRDLKWAVRGVVSFFWFTGVQLVSLSWMASTEFQGVYILFVYAFLAGCLGMQFGLFSLLIKKPSWSGVLGLAGLWTLVEWARLWILCGFSWNPVGLSLTSFSSSLQLASVGGVYFLSWIVIATNLLVFKLWQDKVTLKTGVVMGLVFACPYVFGGGLQHLPMQKEGKLSIALMQPGLEPSQKGILPGKEEQFILPLEQWKRMCAFLSVHKEALDLLVFPEAAVSYQAYRCIYPYSQVVNILVEAFGSRILEKLPALERPFAEERGALWYVSNAFWAKALACIFQAEVIIGLDHTEEKEGKSFNSAFYFSAEEDAFKRYDKRILMPLAEYLPFSFLLPFVQYYGIFDFFVPGKEPLVVGKKVPMSLSICYEETFPHLVREGLLKGAKLFVNLTNDGYYPRTLLPWQHYFLGRLRAVENGVPVVRACNTGVSAVVDCLGKERMRLEADEPGVLFSTFPLFFKKTLYGWIGDYGILSLCVVGLGLLSIYGLAQKRGHPLNS